MKQWLSFLSGFLASTSFLLAGPLEQASVTKIVQDVRVIDPAKGGRAAKIDDVISGDLGVKTGVKSRAELLFQDHTLTRLGAETFFSFRPGTRDLSLERGTMLLQVPKGLGGTKIRAASVTASITGTTLLVEHLPGSSLKVAVLEGSVRLSLNNRIGETIALTPGKMVIMNPNARSIPAPVDIDLGKLIKTSSLIDGKAQKTSARSSRTLPSMGLIEKEIARQEKEKASRGLANTNLVIFGKGTKVTAASDDLLLALDEAANAGRGISLAEGRADLVRGGRPPGGSSNNGSGNNGGSDGEPTDPPEEVPVLKPLLKPLPRPDWSAKAPPAPLVPIVTAHAKPIALTLPVLAPDAGPESRMQFHLKPKTPQVQATGPTQKGTIYGGTAIDGLASAFLFDVTSDFDAQMAFDSRVGAPDGSGFPASSIAAFRFTSLEITDRPVIKINPDAPTALALVSNSQITWNSAATQFALGGGLTSLLLATVEGQIILPGSLTISAAADNGFEFLHLYSRGGASGVTIRSAVNLPTGAFFIDSEKSIAIGNAARISAEQAVFTAGENLAIDGSLTARLLQAEARKELSLAGVLSADRLLGFGEKISVSGVLTSRDLRLQSVTDLDLSGGATLRGASISLTAGATLNFDVNTNGGIRVDFTDTASFEANANKILLSEISLEAPAATHARLIAGAGGIDANGSDLVGFDVVRSEGDIIVRNLDAVSVVVPGKQVKASGNLAAQSLEIGDKLEVGGAITWGRDDLASTAHVFSAKEFQVLGGLMFGGAAGDANTRPGAGGHIELHGEQVLFKADALNGANLNGGDAALAANFEGGNGGFLSVGTDDRPITGEISVEVPISTTTGTNSDGVQTGGKGGTVKMVSNDRVFVNSTVTVSRAGTSAASRSGGHISIASRKTSGTAIQIENSGQLLSLLSAAAPGTGGTIKFTSEGGDILVNGGTVQADRGRVEIQNNGAAGVVNLTNATLSGDVVKVGALGNDGQLIIGGGRIDADSAIRLYAGGSNGKVHFVNDVTLGGQSTKVIAANTVEVANGVMVTVRGSAPANVFTNNANYTGSGGNGSTTGTFAGQGARTNPLANAPAF